MSVDFGYQQVSPEIKSKKVTQVFSSVASNYDLMNDLMSLGIHRIWKRQAIISAMLKPNHQVLDLCCGTGDMSSLIAKKLINGKLYCCDSNMDMLEQCQEKLIDTGVLAANYILSYGESLPIDSNSFDRIIIAFGFRNLTDKSKALNELYRVLKPGGKLIILEFSHPTNSSFAKIYDAYSFNIIPMLGKLIAKDSASYRYLVESIRMHPKQDELQEMLTKHQFSRCEYQNLTGGICAIHSGHKY